MSYKLWFANFFINRFNIIVQRLVEHGIIAYLKEENKRIMRLEDHHADRVIAHAVNPVSLNDIQDTFLIFFGGLLIASLSILIECLVVKIVKYKTARRITSSRIPYLN